MTKRQFTSGENATDESLLPRVTRQISEGLRDTSDSVSPLEPALVAVERRAEREAVRDCAAKPIMSRRSQRSGLSPSAPAGRSWLLVDISNNDRWLKFQNYISAV